MATESVAITTSDKADELQKRMFSAICALLDAQGICELVDESECMSDAEFPDTVRAAMSSVQKHVNEALRILENEEA